MFFHSTIQAPKSSRRDIVLQPPFFPLSSRPIFNTDLLERPALLSKAYVLTCRVLRNVQDLQLDGSCYCEHITCCNIHFSVFLYNALCIQQVKSTFLFHNQLVLSTLYCLLIRLERSAFNSICKTTCLLSMVTISRQ